MLRAMSVDVTAKTVEPTPTSVVAAAVTWAGFPQAWQQMLDQVWSFLRSGATATHTGSIANLGDTYQAVRMERGERIPAGRP